MRDGLVAGAVAWGPSGVPSTLHALVTGRSALEATRAAGSVLVGRGAGAAVQVAAAGVVHTALSLGSGVVLSFVLPGRRAVLWGAAAGLGIAALDLGVVGARIPAVRALHQPAQWADHVAFGAVAGWVIGRRRAAQAPRAGVGPGSARSRARTRPTVAGSTPMAST
jgi:hypothetical protein